MNDPIKLPWDHRQTGLLTVLELRMLKTLNHEGLVTISMLAIQTSQQAHLGGYMIGVCLCREEDFSGPLILSNPEAASRTLGDRKPLDLLGKLEQ